MIEVFITLMAEEKQSSQINLLQVQASSDTPEPESTPFPEGHGVHVVNLLSARLHWSAGQFSQPVD